MPTKVIPTRHAVRHRRLTFVALICLATALGATLTCPSATAASGPAPGSLASSPGPLNQGTAYVANYGADFVTPIAAATNAAGPSITTGGNPLAIAVTPDGTTAYAVNVGSDTVTPIATATNTAGTPVPVGAQPEFIAIAPDGTTAYIVNTHSNSAGAGTVTPIATATNTPGPAIPVGAGPDAIAITPDSATAYVGNGDVNSGFGPGTVTPIATATNTAGAPITVGSDPFSIAITPDGKTAYVSGDDVATGSGTVTPISVATNTPGPSIQVGGGAIAITPNGKTAYVISSPYTVTPITIATNIPGPPITVGGNAVNIAITPNGKTAYVTNETSNTVTPIMIATNTAGPAIPVGNSPYALAITPDSKTVYVANYGSGTVTPIATATNTAGPAITVGSYPHAIAIAPAPAPQPPAFTSASADTAAFGVPYTFTVATTGEPPATVSRMGRLPSGLSFTNTGNGTATISGTPANGAAGLYPLTFTAKNKSGTATQAFTLTVTRAPAIKKIHTIRARVGVPTKRILRATGYPAPAFTESGPLPVGLSFSDSRNGTAVISGTPAPGSGGRYHITITATNASGATARRVILLIAQREVPGST